eukprot:TRINITY_DN252_c0_g1_i1.p1 TRINITY_DN252_c0_g1~~TRINITY_DN252_c0_g1_i1.p1  ORF type:complete len:1516 (+),score=756.42 TRINITY_DN252_c0_g1_i1:156-4703(+)
MPPQRLPSINKSGHRRPRGMKRPGNKDRERGWDDSTTVLNEDQIPANKPVRAKRSGKPQQHPSRKTKPNSVVNNLDFVNYPDADQQLQLVVLKNIMIREEYKRRMRITARQVVKGETTLAHKPDQSGLLDLMYAMRMITLDTIEALEKWQKALTNPKPFIWKGLCYLTTMCNDMNFLAEVKQLIDILKVPASTIIRNPCFMPQNIDESPKTVVPESKQAWGDEKVKTEEEKMMDRITIAQQVLLKAEMEDLNRQCDQPQNARMVQSVPPRIRNRTQRKSSGNPPRRLSPMADSPIQGFDVSPHQSKTMAPNNPPARYSPLAESLKQHPKLKRFPVNKRADAVLRLLGIKTTVANIVTLSKTPNPPMIVELISAAVAIITSPSNRLPADLRWSATKDNLCGRTSGRQLVGRLYESRQHLMNDEKLSALESVVQDPLFNRRAATDAGTTCGALYSFIIRVFKDSQDGHEELKAKKNMVDMVEDDAERIAAEEQTAMEEAETTHEDNNNNNNETVDDLLPSLPSPLSSARDKTEEVPKVEEEQPKPDVVEEKSVEEFDENTIKEEDEEDGFEDEFDDDKKSESNKEEDEEIKESAAVIPEIKEEPKEEKIEKSDPEAKEEKPKKIEEEVTPVESSEEKKTKEDEEKIESVPTSVGDNNDDNDKKKDITTDSVVVEEEKKEEISSKDDEDDDDEDFEDEFDEDFDDDGFEDDVEEEKEKEEPKKEEPSEETPVETKPVETADKSSEEEEKEQNANNDEEEDEIKYEIDDRVVELEEARLIAQEAEREEKKKVAAEEAKQAEKQRDLEYAESLKNSEKNAVEAEKKRLAELEARNTFGVAGALYGSTLVCMALKRDIEDKKKMRIVASIPSLAGHCDCPISLNVKDNTVNVSFSDEISNTQFRSDQWAGLFRLLIEEKSFICKDNAFTSASSWSIDHPELIMPHGAQGVVELKNKKPEIVEEESKSEETKVEEKIKSDKKDDDDNNDDDDFEEDAFDDDFDDDFDEDEFDEKDEEVPVKKEDEKTEEVPAEKKKDEEVTPEPETKPVEVVEPESVDEKENNEDKEEDEIKYEIDDRVVELEEARLIAQEAEREEKKKVAAEEAKQAEKQRDLEYAESLKNSEKNAVEAEKKRLAELEARNTFGVAGALYGSTLVCMALKRDIEDKKKMRIVASIPSLAGHCDCPISLNVKDNTVNVSFSDEISNTQFRSDQWAGLFRLLIEEKSFICKDNAFTSASSWSIDHPELIMPHGAQGVVELKNKKPEIVEENNNNELDEKKSEIVDEKEVDDNNNNNNDKKKDGDDDEEEENFDDDFDEEFEDDDFELSDDEEKKEDPKSEVIKTETDTPSILFERRLTDHGDLMLKLILSTEKKMNLSVTGSDVENESQNLAINITDVADKKCFEVSFAADDHKIVPETATKECLIEIAKELLNMLPTRIESESSISVDNIVTNWRRIMVLHQDTKLWLLKARPCFCVKNEDGSIQLEQKCSVSGLEAISCSPTNFIVSPPFMKGNQALIEQL